MERGGKTLKEILCQTNPWAGDGCTRDDCLPCMGERGRGGNCQKENIVYRILCQECELGHIKAEYTGESSRTPYLRGREHLDGLEKRKEDNALWKHCAQVHQGREVKFKMRVLRSHRTPMSRQIQEAVEIENSKADILMNSKGEWNGSRIPRIVIEVGEKIQEGEEKNTEDISWSSMRKRNWAQRGEISDREKKRKGNTDGLNKANKKKKKRYQWNK